MKSDLALWRVLGEPVQAKETAKLERLRKVLPGDRIATARVTGPILLSSAAHTAEGVSIWGCSTDAD